MDISTYIYICIHLHIFMVLLLPSAHKYVLVHAKWPIPLFPLDSPNLHPPHLSLHCRCQPLTHHHHHNLCGFYFEAPVMHLSVRVCEREKEDMCVSVCVYVCLFVYMCACVCMHLCACVASRIFSSRNTAGEGERGKYHELLGGNPRQQTGDMIVHFWGEKKTKKRGNAATNTYVLCVKSVSTAEERHVMVRNARSSPL